MIRTNQKINGMVRTTPSNGKDGKDMALSYFELSSLVGKKHAGGRPTKYDPDSTPELAALAVLNVGPTDIDIARALGIHFMTVSAWEKEKPKFCLAIKKAREHHLYYRGLDAKQYGFTIFCLKNWCDWKDVQQIDEKRSIEVTRKAKIDWSDIPPEDMEILRDMTAEERRRHIKLIPMGKKDTDIIDITSTVTKRR